jgi:hypothetical protein
MKKLQNSKKTNKKTKRSENSVSKYFNNNFLNLKIIVHLQP